ncbi:methylaspartate mutase accessory protein GlmL [soil metagenome]
MVDEDDGTLVAHRDTPTTLAGDVLDGIRAVAADLAAGGHRVPELGDRDRVLACSSAGGGLRLAVVGYERQVTAEAGHRVGLSAGASVVHVAAGRLGPADVDALSAARPDLVLLVGGTDGGNAEVLLHNAGRLASRRLGVPVVVAGNAEARQEVGASLARTGRRFFLTDNVLPRIGVVAPGPARSAIREVFLRHVIGGKGLSRGPAFRQLVRAATPDAVLTGVEVLSDASGEDFMVVDVGGATTDVYSVITPAGEDATLRKEVVATLWHARTVEGDLGMRWSAPGVFDAARAEGLVVPDEQCLRDWVDRVHLDPGRLPRDAVEVEFDLTLARLAVVVAVRRHARPDTPGGRPRPLVDLARLIGSGGVLRHASPAAAATVLTAVLHDHGGGWRPPAAAHPAVDTAYLLFVAGLLADKHPGLARAAAAQMAALPGDQPV